MAGLAVMCVHAPAQAASATTADLMQAMHGLLRPSPGTATPAAMTDLGPVAADTVVPLTLYLKPSDPAGLAALVASIQDPGGR